MGTFRFLEASHNYPSLRIQIEGFSDPICKRVDKEDVRGCRAGEISKEEIVAKYFSAEIDLALAKRLRQLSGIKLPAEVKKIERNVCWRSYLQTYYSTMAGANISESSSCHF